LTHENGAVPDSELESSFLVAGTFNFFGDFLEENKKVWNNILNSSKIVENLDLVIKIKS